MTVLSHWIYGLLLNSYGNTISKHGNLVWWHQVVIKTAACQMQTILLGVTLVLAKTTPPQAYDVQFANIQFVVEHWHKCNKE